jgi:hypothetical protein
LFLQGTAAYAVEHPRADPHTPDFGARVLGEEAFRGGKSVVIDDLCTAVNIDGHDFSLVGRLDLSTDMAIQGS